MRRFVLCRVEDATGVSGVGTVIWGLQFPDGRCAYRWNTATSTTTVADSIEDVVAVHGHDGRTRVVWLDTVKGAGLWRLARPDGVVTVDVAASDLIAIGPDEVDAVGVSGGGAAGQS